MTRSVSADEILRTVSLLSGIDESALKSRTWRRPLKQARIAAAHLLLVHCGLPRVAIGQHIGRSDQTVSELTARAKRSLAAGGPAADLIALARRRDPGLDLGDFAAAGRELDRMPDGVFAQYGLGPAEAAALREAFAAWPR